MRSFGAIAIGVTTALAFVACGREGPPPKGTFDLGDAGASTNPTATSNANATSTPTSNATSNATANLCTEKCTGTVGEELVAALGAAARKSRSCYEAALAKDATLAGKLVVEVKVDRNGGVCSIVVPHADPAMKDVAICTKGQFEQLKTLPAPTGGCIYAQVPIAYVPQAKDAGRD